MAIVNENSTQIANSLAEPRVFRNAYDDHGRVRVAKFDATRAVQGDAGSLTNLVRFDASRPVRLLRMYIAWSALGTARTLDLGLGGYTGGDGNAVAADPDAFVANIAAATAGAQAVEINQLIDPKSAFDITAQVNDGTHDAGETLEGYVEYVED